MNVAEKETLHVVLNVFAVLGVISFAYALLYIVPIAFICYLIVKIVEKLSFYLYNLEDDQGVKSYQQVKELFNGI